MHGWISRPRRKAFTISALLAIGLAARAGRGADMPITEYRVKALFLLNFARYVEWPADGFENASSPIVIGVIGEDRFGVDLAAAVEGKRVDGRPILSREVRSAAESEACQILFISASEGTGIGGILRRIRTRPILSVGESDQFMELGGIVNFVKKHGKVRLEISLDAARAAQLKISSKLLSVADVVKVSPD